jgi:hypothetical protein
MSGAAGGSRINKEDLKTTIRDYRDNILKPLGLDKSYNITGVRSRPEKDIFGDIDIVVSFPEGDKKELKQQFASFLTQNDKVPVIPSKNKKYFIHGNIVSTLYPIANKEGEYVQIDNIVTVTKEEGKFAFQMLDLPAQEQTLAIGLVKTIFTELDEKQVENLFNDLGIASSEKPGEGEEYDFNLNPAELTLRIVPVGKNEGKQIWKSNSFEDVKKILLALGINIEKDKFEDIVSKIKKFKNRRSIDRLKGMFAKNIRVGDAEKAIEKGIKKQQALDTVASLEEKYNPLIMGLIKPFILEDTNTQPTIAIFPGKFKPPHKDHLARIQAAAADADEVYVLVSPKSSEEKPNQKTITAQQSIALFDLYRKKGLIPSNVKIYISDNLPFKGDNDEQLSFNSPVKSAYEIMDKRVGPNYIAVFGKEEDLKRFGKVPKNTVVKNYDGSAGNLSATDLRIALKNDQDVSQFLPKDIDTSDILKEHCGCDDSLPTTLKDAMLSLTTYMIENDMNIIPLPKIKIIDDDSKNAEGIFGSTAYYNPNECSITLYTLNRHPKDILRSYAHEMIHRIQDNEGRLKNVTTTNTNEDDDLLELEKEAYLNGNITFRNWEDSLKNPKSVNEIYFLDSEKYNRPRTIHENLWHTLNEIILSPNNAVEINGDLTKGKFQVGNIKYTYDIKQVSNPYDDGGRFFNIMFHPEDNITSTPQEGKENYIKILSTMYKVILDFAEEAEPEYIGISSLDNNKNYHMVYANLTDNKSNRIPGYFRKDVNLEFNTPQGKGRFVVLKRKDESLNEGRYDTVSNKSSSMIFNKWKQDFLAGKKQSVLKTFVESEDVEFGLVATLKFKNEGEDLQVDGGLEETEDGNIIYVDFKVDRNILPEMWSEISMNLKDVMRHEIEHITQNDELNYPSKFMEDDLIARIAINQDLLPRGEYFKLEKEIDANLQGMYFRAKKEKRPFTDVINDYLDAQSLTPEQREEVLNLWRPRAIKLSLPKF